MGHSECHYERCYWFFSLYPYEIAPFLCRNRTRTQGKVDHRQDDDCVTTRHLLADEVSISSAVDENGSAELIGYYWDMGNSTQYRY